MSKIRVINRHSVPCMDVVGKEEESFRLVPVDEDADDSLPRVRHLHPGSAVDLQMKESTLPPFTGAESHAHLTDEIIFVLDGEMVIGAHR